MWYFVYEKSAQKKLQKKNKKNIENEEQPQKRHCKSIMYHINEFWRVIYFPLFFLHT